MSFASPREFLAEISENFSVRLLERPSIAKAAEEAIAELNRWNKRECPLKPLLIVWLVISMVIHRNLSIPNVFRRLLDAAGAAAAWLSRPVTPEALLHARRRLGHEVLALMFSKEVQAARPARPLVFGLRACGVDGVHFTVPDTETNIAAFGKKRGGRGQAAYPQLLGVCLVDLASRRIADCRFSGCCGDEREAASEFIAEQLGSTELIMMDRGIASYRVFAVCESKRTWYLARISSTWKPRLLRPLGPGDVLVELVPSKTERQRAEKAGIHLPESLTARLICYRVGDAQPVRLLTNLLDTARYPAHGLALEYHRRWECEIVYKELKNELAAVSHGKQDTTFRSKTPDDVLQEAWAMMLTYNIVRELMLEAADLAGIDPLELSFADTLEKVKLWMPHLQRATDSEREDLYARFLAEVARLRIARPRRKRAYPRVVKRKMSNFHLKRRHHRQKMRDFAEELVLFDPGEGA